MITLTIKGTLKDAKEALTAHSIGTATMTERVVADQSITKAEISEAHIKVVMLWYGETEGKPPYPPGTLLHFSMPNKEE